MPPPAKKSRALSATPRPKPTRVSIPWTNGALCTPAHPVDESLAEINEEDDDEEVEIGEGQASAYQQVCETVKGLFTSLHKVFLLFIGHAAIKIRVTRCKILNVACKLSFKISLKTFALKESPPGFSVRKQPTFGDAISGFSEK